MPNPSGPANPNLCICLRMTQIHTNKNSNPGFYINLRMTRINTNENNPLDYIWMKMCSRVYSRFYEHFLKNSPDSRFHASSGFLPAWRIILSVKNNRLQGMNGTYTIACIIPNYALDHKLHELTQIKTILTQIKTIKSIDLDLYENSLRGLFVILLIFFVSIRVIRGLMHYLGL